MVLDDKALTTLENVKLYLGIPVIITTYDDLLIELINIASSTIEAAIGRDISIQDYVEFYEGTGTTKLLLNAYPVTVITELKIEDEVNTDFRVNLKTGTLTKISSRWPVSGYVSGMSRMVVEKIESIEVSYTAGYVLPKTPQAVPKTLPASVEGLTKRMVSKSYNTAGNEGLDSFSISDVNWSWVKEVPAEDTMIIHSFKRMRI